MYFCKMRSSTVSSVLMSMLMQHLLFALLCMDLHDVVVCDRISLSWRSWISVEQKKLRGNSNEIGFNPFLQTGWEAAPHKTAEIFSILTLNSRRFSQSKIHFGLSPTGFVRFCQKTLICLPIQEFLSEDPEIVCPIYKIPPLSNTNIVIIWERWNFVSCIQVAPLPQARSLHQRKICVPIHRHRFASVTEMATYRMLWLCNVKSIHPFKKLVYGTLYFLQTRSLLSEWTYWNKSDLVSYPTLPQHFWTAR
jgi:hypothetical protein